MVSISSTGCGGLHRKWRKVVLSSVAFTTLKPFFSVGDGVSISSTVRAGELC